jgi:hypothetical protein
MRECSDGAAIVSTYTAPVNQSLGPGFVSRVFLVICNEGGGCSRFRMTPARLARYRGFFLGKRFLGEIPPSQKQRCLGENEGSR